MRKTLIALAATTGLLSLGSVGASAVTLGATVPTAQPSHAAIQQADWGCGPNCETGVTAIGSNATASGATSTTPITATTTAIAPITPDLSQGMAPLRRSPITE